MKHPAACNDPPDHQQRGDISRFDEAALNILRAVDRGDYAGIAAAIDDDGQNLPRKGSRTGAQELSTATLLTLQRLIPALAEIQSSSRYATMVIALKPAADTKLPDDDGYALYTDDGNAASVTIRGGSGLFGHKFSAYLENAGSRKLLASQVTLEGDGEAINVTFPSFAHIDGLTALSGVRLIVEMKDEKRDIQRKYELRKVTAADAEQKAVDSNPVSASHDVIVAVKGQATVRLRVGGLPAELGANMPWHLEVTGAEVRGMDQQPVLKANSVMALALEHLSERRPVLIKTADAKNKAVGSPLSFSVEKSGE